MWAVDLHGTLPVQRGPIETELNEYGASGRVLAAFTGLYGGTSTDYSLILDLAAFELALK